MSETNISDRSAKLAIVREINKLIDQCTVGVNWLSDELQTSYTERSTRRHGPGEEERGLKRYESGDNIRHIHLPATLMATQEDEVYIRTFFQSRVVRFNVLLNVGPSMNFGTHNTLKTRLGAAVAGAGLQSALLPQDIPSYVTYGNRPLTVRIEHNASDLLLDALMHFVQDGEKADRQAVGGGLAKAYEAIRYLDRSVTLVVDDFANMSSADWEALRLLGAQHDTMACFVQDPRERELPEVPWPGAAYTFEDCAGLTKHLWVTPDGMSGFMRSLLGKLLPGFTVTSREQYAENFRRHAEQVMARLRKCGIHAVVASTDKARDDIGKLLRLLARTNR